MGFGKMYLRKLYRKYILKKKIKLNFRYRFAIYYSFTYKKPDDMIESGICWIDETKRMRKWLE